MNYSSEIQNSNKKKYFIIIITFIITVIMLILLLNIKVYRINGTSMYPTLVQGKYVVCLKSTNIKRGDIVAFYKNDNFVIKRVVALPNETIDISEEGTVSINGTELKEEYLTEKGYGIPDIKFPYKNGSNSYFVLGDNRENSLDSRHYQIGTLTKEDIICKVKLVL